MIDGTFNLLFEPWIPVTDLHGQHSDVSLLTLFTQARTLRRIDTAHPFQDAALHRLCLSVITRAATPRGRRDLSRWFSEDLPSGAISAYLLTHQDRFDLLHPDAPFMQVADLGATSTTKDGGPRPYTVLGAEYAGDNTKVLFNHTNLQDPPPISLAQAARMLVTAQQFSLGAGNSPTGYTTHAPAATSAVTWTEGDTLAQTLALNLTPYTHEDAVPLDQPVWERPPLRVADVTARTTATGTVTPERLPAGPADRYTWQSRAVRLLPQHSASGHWHVQFLHYGMGIKPLTAPGVWDPMVGRDQSLKPGKKEPEDVARRLRPERHLWRDLHALVALEHDLHRQPDVLSRATITLARLDLNHTHVTVNVVGQLSDRASTEAWRHERFSFPLACLDHPQRRALLGTATRLAEQCGEILSHAQMETARTLADIQANTSTVKAAGRPTESRVAAGLHRTMPGLTRYYDLTGRAFSDLLSRLDTLDVHTELPGWQRALTSAAWQAWAENDTFLGTHRGALDGLMRGEALLNRRLRTFTRAALITVSGAA